MTVKKLTPTLNLLAWLFLIQAIALPFPGQARTAAPAPGRPALDEFGSGLYLARRDMAKIMGELQARYGKEVEIRLVQADEDKDLFKQYKIMLIPTQVFLDASGKEVERHVGALSREDVVILTLAAVQFCCPACGPTVTDQCLAAGYTPEDLKEIAGLGVMGMPALNINGEVKAVGQTPTREALKRWFLGEG